MSDQSFSKKIDCLSIEEIGSNASKYDFLIGEGEFVELEYKAFRDIAVFTNKKLILMDVQGITGSKKEWLILPYSKCTAFSVESAGTFDLDAEIKIWTSGIGLVELELVKGNDVRQVAAMLVNYIG